MMIKIKVKYRNNNNKIIKAKAIIIKNKYIYNIYV